MAENTTPLGKDWKSYECALALRECLKTARVRRKGLKKAVVENDLEEVRALLEGGRRHAVRVNNRLVFACQGYTLQVPPLCVAICHRNVAIMQCLLKHGANPNRSSFVCLEESVSGMKTSGSITPLMFALKDHTSDRTSFDSEVASALVQGGADIESVVCSSFGEEEEEGGSIRYSRPCNLLFNLVNHPQASALPSFKFLLNNGATMVLSDTYCKNTVLHTLLDNWSTKPEGSIILTFAKELIRFGGFDSCPTPVRNLSSEFLLLLKAWAISSVAGPIANETLLPRIIHFILDAGYICSKYEVGLFKAYSLSGDDQCMVDKVCGMHVYSLKQLCRLKIRNSVRHGCQLQKLTCLPRCLIGYLMFSEI